jgi:hypothetical protein
MFSSQFTNDRQLGAAPERSLAGAHGRAETHVNATVPVVFPVAAQAVGSIYPQVDVVTHAIRVMVVHIALDRKAVTFPSPNSK